MSIVLLSGFVDLYSLHTPIVYIYAKMLLIAI